VTAPAVVVTAPAVVAILDPVAHRDSSTLLRGGRAPFSKPLALRVVLGFLVANS